MRFTNKADLPEGIVKAIINDDYTKGKADYSQSNLVKPAQMARLERLHYNDIEVDVSDEIWKLFGKAIHYVIEKNSETENLKDVQLSFLQNSRKETFDSIHNLKRHITNSLLIEKADIINDVYGELLTLESSLTQPLPTIDSGLIIKEERIYFKLADKIISCQMDWFNILDSKLEDHKVTSVWKVLKGDYHDWTIQENTYRLALKHNGYDVTSLQINAILKDWKKFEQGRDPNYPPLAVAKIAIPIMSYAEISKYLLNRIELHESVKEVDSPEELYKLAPCSNVEKWYSGSTFAVKKQGNKVATKGGSKFDTPEEANTFITNLETPELYYVEERKGINKRCEEYCPVKQWCAQYAKENDNQTINLTPIPTEKLLDKIVEVEPNISQEVLESMKFKPYVVPEFNEIPTIDEVKEDTAKFESSEYSEDKVQPEETHSEKYKRLQKEVQDKVFSKDKEKESEPEDKNEVEVEDYNPESSDGVSEINIDEFFVDDDGSNDPPEVKAEIEEEDKKEDSSSIDDIFKELNI